VVELQINFGGGKPHSMLALWHLFAGVPAGQLLGLETPTCRSFLQTTGQIVGPILTAAAFL
jgi:predicted AAA+ superfamily ATPase